MREPDALSGSPYREVAARKELSQRMPLAKPSPTPRLRVIDRADGSVSIEVWKQPISVPLYIVGFLFGSFMAIVVGQIEAWILLAALTLQVIGAVRDKPREELSLGRGGLMLARNDFAMKCELPLAAIDSIEVYDNERSFIVLKYGGRKLFIAEPSWHFQPLEREHVRWLADRLRDAVERARAL